jgi:hypothetical protein
MLRASNTRDDLFVHARDLADQVDQQDYEEASFSLACIFMLAADAGFFSVAKAASRASRAITAGAMGALGVDLFDLADALQRLSLSPEATDDRCDAVWR